MGNGKTILQIYFYNFKVIKLKILIHKRMINVDI